MRPENSWPRVTGMWDFVSGCGEDGRGHARGPWRYSWMSLPQIPHHERAIRASWSWGVGSEMEVMRMSFWPKNCAAFIVDDGDGKWEVTMSLGSSRKWVRNVGLDVTGKRRRCGRSKLE